ncbi:MAG: hypothetical protein JW741_03880 [Sedimentisphaerales bacterium]|nr:hypothetical protein [Sedimentisphaerales bacterium]
MVRTCIQAAFLLILSGIVASAYGGVDFPDPTGGWTYVYTGDDATAGGPFESLDGTWDHDNGSDEWDGSVIGEGRPGGASALTEGDVAFLRLQDTGDPRDFDLDDPGSNRKIFFGHSATNDIADAAAAWLDTGVTISFRARVATTPPLDDLHPDGGGSTSAYPAEGDGYLTHDGGKGNFGVRQPDDDKLISFALALASDDDELQTGGLVMPKLNGADPTDDVDLQDDDDGEINILEIADPTAWHEFWIVIQADTSETGTHAVTIYMDGDLTPHEFIVTAGTGNDYDDAYIAMEVGATPQSGAIDIDFMAYKEGIVLPPGALENAHAPDPANGATDVIDTTSLSWVAGDNAVTHDVYFGETFADVNDGTAFVGNQAATVYTPPAALDFGATYYWRIDEQNNDGTVSRGAVWVFTVADFILVDDMESYGDEITPGEPGGRIWYVWKDGLGWSEPAPGSAGNGTGAAVGNWPPPVAETQIVRGGQQALPFFFTNSAAPNYSEAQADTADLPCGRDWTRKGVKALSLWYRGNPPSLGSFVEAPVGTFTVTGAGADMAGTADEFHFAYKEASGGTTVTARITEFDATAPSAKAGVMIRGPGTDDTGGAASAVNAALLVSPGGGLILQLRASDGQNTTVAQQQASLAAPIWLRLEITSGGLVRANYSSNGSKWIPIGGSQVVGLIGTRQAGLAVTSSNQAEAATATFTDVSFSNAAAAWTNNDVGISSNPVEPMYVALTDSVGNRGILFNEDPNATTTIQWTEWSVALQDFADQGVNLASVAEIALGVGDPDNPQPGGDGVAYFDDIRLYQPRCVLDKITALEADLNKDCRVDYLDLVIMVNDWFMGDSTRTGRLLLRYDLNEGSGTVAGDSSGNGQDGAITGATWGTPGFDGTGACLLFDGAAGEVNEPGAAAYMNGLDALTVAVWVKSNVIDTDKGFIIFTDPDGTDQRDIRYDVAGGSSGGTNVIKYGVTSTGGNQENESSSGVQTTEWQHVAVTWKSGEVVRLYINGALNIPGFEAEPAVGTTTGYTKVLVGRGGKDADGAWDGRVDDVRIYDWALSAEEIATVENGGTVMPPEIYTPVGSPAELWDAEQINSRKVNFNDYAILAGQWLEERLWP